MSTSETAPRRAVVMAPARVVVLAVSAMARPGQLLLVMAVILLGAAFAAAHGASPDLATAVAGLLALLPVAAGIHLANEYADHETDGLTSRTPFSGGSGALVRTGLPRSVALPIPWRPPGPIAPPTRRSASTRSRPAGSRSPCAACSRSSRDRPRRCSRQACWPGLPSSHLPDCRPCR